jgi:hypothetical protein
MVFVLLVDLNLAAVIKDETSNSYVWCAGYLNFTWNMSIVLITGIFIAGGSKASPKLFRDVLGIQSSFAARTR